MIYKLIAALLFLSVLISCGPRTQDCPAVTPDDVAWLVYTSTDTVRFTNGSEHIKFAVQQKNESASYSEDCKTDGLLTHFCKTCESNANVKATSTSERNQQHNLYVSITDSYNITYYVFDGFGAFPMANNVLVNTVTLGGITYHDVYISQSDTTQTPAPVVWKTYYNKQYGILGFEDRQTHSTFHRQ